MQVRRTNIRTSNRPSGDQGGPTVPRGYQQVAALGEQLAQAGQLAADATEDDKRRAALAMVDEQIDQMQSQLKRFEDQKSRESRQRFIGGTATAAVLALAFTLLALTAVLDCRLGWSDVPKPGHRGFWSSPHQAGSAVVARLRQDLKNDLIAGLLVVIPLATTIWLSTIVSRFVLAFLTSIPKQFNRSSP